MVTGASMDGMLYSANGLEVICGGAGEHSRLALKFIIAHDREISPARSSTLWKRPACLTTSMLDG